ncbi:MAG: endonuclease/exonuclease/phosphatase family protein [Alphaproteobacteria bacterium]
MRLILLILAVVLVATTVVPLVRTGAWWVRAFDFPRLQLAVAMLAVLGAYLVFYRRGDMLDVVLILALAASFGYQVFRIYPYMPFAKTQAVAAHAQSVDTRVRLLIANVLMSNRNADDLIELIRRYEPDVVLAVETDDWWGERLAVLADEYPHRVEHPLPNTYGMHRFSRLELVEPAVRKLIEDEVPSVHTGLRLRNGTVVDFYGVHPRPPRPGEDSDGRDAELLIVGREIKATGRPAIVAGDLNDVAWSHTTRLFQRISGTLDPRVGRGIFASFHAKIPLLRWPLDHVFFDESFALGRIELLPAFGSDHFPVFAELYHQPAAEAEQEPPQANGEDREEAADKIQEGREAHQ